MRVTILATVTGVFFGAVSMIANAEIAELDKAACDAKGGLQICTTIGIPGDGNRHNVSIQAASPTTKLLGGYARTFRQGLDNSYMYKCMMNPPQPPADANSLQRRCDQAAQDMSVERCTTTSGSSPTLSCEYVNAKGANPKMLELCGCWK